MTQPPDVSPPYRHERVAPERERVELKWPPVRASWETAPERRSSGRTRSLATGVGVVAVIAVVVSVFVLTEESWRVVLLVGAYLAAIIAVCVWFAVRGLVSAIRERRVLRGLRTWTVGLVIMTAPFALMLAWIALVPESVAHSIGRRLLVMNNVLGIGAWVWLAFKALEFWDHRRARRAGCEHWHVAHRCVDCGEPLAGWRAAEPPSS